MGNRSWGIEQNVCWVSLQVADTRTPEISDNSDDPTPILHTPFPTTALLDTF